ncbi:MAG: hypothetical protein AB1531_06155 [Chloroflexota bacterium]
MSAVKKIFSVLGWIITIVLQIAFGQVAGTFALAIGQGRMPESMIFLGMGIAVGVYIIGALAILLRRAIRPKKYLARLGFTCVGVLIPIAILVAVGLSQGFDSEILNGGLGLLLTLLACILGVVGFYLPGWVKRR